MIKLLVGKCGGVQTTGQVKNHVRQWRSFYYLGDEGSRMIENYRDTPRQQPICQPTFSGQFLSSFVTHT
jgi:hypothetical protein